MLQNFVGQEGPGWVDALFQQSAHFVGSFQECIDEFLRKKFCTYLSQMLCFLNDNMNLLLLLDNNLRSLFLRLMQDKELCIPSVPSFSYTTRLDYRAKFPFSYQIIKRIEDLKNEADNLRRGYSLFLPCTDFCRRSIHEALREFVSTKFPELRGLLPEQLGLYRNDLAMFLSAERFGNSPKSIY